jgi:hypothetical protein
MDKDVPSLSEQAYDKALKYELDYGCDRDKLDCGRYINNFKKARELTERFRAEFGGVTCRELQQQFTGRTYDMWDAGEYKAFDDARGQKCAHATGTVTKWVVELL